MRLQLRVDRFHGFCIIVIRQKRVVRCHELPCEGDLDDFFNLRMPLQRSFWLKGSKLNEVPQAFGELIAVRRRWSVILFRPARYHQLLEEIATIPYADREAFLRTCQQSLDDQANS